jgi:hypothetical protein
MENKQFITAHGFESIEQYFDYIIESRINGQHSQARELFNQLSDGMQGQRAQFFEYISGNWQFVVVFDDNSVDSWKQYFGIKTES